jgi:hypothetical protein
LSAAFGLSAAVFSSAATAARGSSTPSLVDAIAFPGANAGAKIRAAINALGSNGGTVDARAHQQADDNFHDNGTGQSYTAMGQVAFTATVVAVFKLGSNSRPIGEGALATPTEATLIQLAGAYDRSAIVGGATGVVIKFIHLRGLSTTDKSIGFDLQGIVNGWIAYNRIEGFGTGVRIGWPGNPWKCDCYNLFIDNQVVGAATGVNFDQSAYKDTWSGAMSSRSVPGVLASVWPAARMFFFSRRREF